MARRRPLVNPTPRTGHAWQQPDTQSVEHRKRRGGIRQRNKRETRPGLFNNEVQISYPSETERQDTIRKQERIPKDQLSMKLDKPLVRFIQRFRGWKMKMQKRSHLLGHSPLWNTQAFSLWVTATIVTVLVMFVGGIFATLPDNIRFFYIPVEESSQQINKSFVFIIPIGLLMYFAIQYRLLSTIFVKDRRLAVTIMWLNAVLATLFFIAILQIYRLVS